MVSVYNIIEYSNNYSRTSGNLCQYYREEPALDDNSNITNFTGNSASFKSKVRIAGKTPADGNTKNARIAVPLKYISTFLRTLEMLLINNEINLILTGSSTGVITNLTGKGTFAITDTKLYVLAVFLSTQDNIKLLDQLKSGFKRKIRWNKYQSKRSIEKQNPYLNYLIDLT